MSKQADDEANKPWLIRDVPEKTRRVVKTYAVQHNITVAEALATLVDLGLQVAVGEPLVLHLDDTEQLQKLADMVARMMERDKEK